MSTETEKPVMTTKASNLHPSTSSFSGIGVPSLMDLDFYDEDEEKYTPPSSGSILQDKRLTNCPRTTTNLAEVLAQTPSSVPSTSMNNHLTHSFTIIKGNYCGGNLSSANQVQPASILSKCEWGLSYNTDFIRFFF